MIPHLVQNLRKWYINSLVMADVITLDGPTSSGKNSVGSLFAQRIGYQFIDTGSIYRAFSIALLKMGVDPSEDDKIEQILNEINVEYKSNEDDQQVFLDGEDITDQLHRVEVSNYTADIAPKEFVREIARRIQRQIGTAKNTVMAGRDIGTIIFPEASLKFYLTASPEVRAQRRYDQIKEKNPEITYERVFKEMTERDNKDTERENSPLKVPEGAVVIDTTNLTTEESVSEFLRYYEERKNV
jgi:CMP/dCMP kinase